MLKKEEIKMLKKEEIQMLKKEIKDNWADDSNGGVKEMGLS